MHVCMYVCVYVCMHVCVYVCLYVCTYVWMDVCMHVCMCACVHVCMYACTHVRMHACMCVCMCVYVCRYVSVCMHVCMSAHLPSQLSQCPQAGLPEKARLPTSVQLPGGASKTSALSAPCSTKDKVGRTSSTPSSCANPRCETPSNSRRPCASIECTSSHDLDTHAG